jgi:hypothetical protein
MERTVVLAIFTGQVSRGRGEESPSCGLVAAAATTESVEVRRNKLKGEKKAGLGPAAGDAN